MDKIILNYLYFIFIVSGFYVLLFMIIKPLFKEKNRIELIKEENIKNKLFMEFDPKIASNELTEFIDDYINDYILKKFIINNIQFIPKNDIEKMIKELDSKVVVELPELYLFYIKMMINVSTDEDLIIFIHKRISDRVLMIVTEFNKPK